MSDADPSPTQNAEDAAQPLPNASLKVDSASLGADELDFAKAMGFADDAPEAKPTRPGRSAPDAPADASVVAERGEERDEENDAAHDVSAIEADDEDAGASRPREARQAGDADWEDIHPRPAADGDQATLSIRADEILADPGVAAADSIPTPSLTSLAPPATRGDEEARRSELDEARQALARLGQKLAERELEIDRLREAFEQELHHQASKSKHVDGLHSELSSLSDERDQLIDQLALSNEQLGRARSRNEQLEASLRAARGSLIPLPEGERALRSEVVGLRARLDEVLQENLGLVSEVAQIATELSIATARVEDRQHEIDHHVDRVAQVEALLAEKDDELMEVTSEHRTLLELSTRLQAEGHELRSTQSALEETLQARDLEIAAREEHLRVTRDGLAARDAQLCELGDRLDEARRRAEQLESELLRDGSERAALLARIDRREARIARLSETLARIEDAMGRPIVGAPTHADPDDDAPRPADG